MARMPISTPRHNTRRKPTAVDLFSGCGGLTEGLRQAGFRVVGAVEIDALAAKSYRMNHPRVRLWNDDIRNLTVSTMRGALDLVKGHLDLLAGCPPCQGFSRVRTLNGNRDVRDRRNSLMDDFLRFVRGLAPRVVMLENVPGLAERRRFREFAAILKGMGYAVNWAVLDAAHYGVPQRRRRLVLLAAKPPAIEFASARPPSATVSQTIGRLPMPGRNDDLLHRVIGKRTERIAEMIKLVPKDGGSRRDLPEDQLLECHKRCNGFGDVYGRMRWDAVAPTITGGCLNPSKGRFLHPTQDRPITAREAALLQSFPPDYRFATDRGMYAVADMIGNALPPEFIRRQALQVVAALKNERDRR
jgi:DNA (cytosine-5)-methyltransferase 1